jgi:pyruvate,orthophosphate dikinase
VTVQQHRKLTYRFDEGDAGMRELLGGKGANLCEMAKLGLPVPPGFIITTESCIEFFQRGGRVPDGLWEDVRQNMALLEESIGRGFGSPTRPLLTSVRSGARISMPGMMDTILNLGINDQIVHGLASLMGDERPAFDAYRRFLQMYASVVMGVEPYVFEWILARHKEEAGVALDNELDPAQLRSIIGHFKSAIREAASADVPEDPWQQLEGAVKAVFESWNSPRATSYRNHYSIPHHWGTAVNIMAMVFGNLGSDSGTGVLFTRNPVNGQRKLYGEYLSNGQGEDVVAGIRNPEPLSSLENQLPAVYAQLDQMAQGLERHYRDVQDMEFTVEQGRLFLLQTRTAQRTVQAAVKTAVDMVEEALIDRPTAVNRVNAEELSQLFVPRFDARARAAKVSARDLLGSGFGASPGAATGKAFFDATRAADAAKKGIPVILVRPETKPDDIHGILGARGVLTSRGGVTSHAAVVTRGLGVPCVVGCEEVHVDVQAHLFSANGRTVLEGDELSVDGTTGEVFAGTIATVQSDLRELPEAQVLLSWADDIRRLGVMANADTPTDAERAVVMGAQGIGLCRTEHMFLGPDRVPVVQKMLINAQEAVRWEADHPESASSRAPSPEMPIGVSEFYTALAHLKGLQIADFTGILRAMGERPVIIRLLDAPLHEFLPQYERLLRELVEMEVRGAPEEDLRPRKQFLEIVESLREANPMLGHRGCRLGLTFPAVYEMQVEAIITASALLIREGVRVHPEIMIPITSHVNELRRLKERLSGVADRVQREMETEVHYLYGTMIEVPRAALTAGEVARVSDFFSFGTNDLTQTTFGFSRDDAESKFLNRYIEDGILPSNPFATLDVDGVGALIRIAVQQGRHARPDLEVGICGEHGGDPASIAFCHREGLNYVSCSPFRVPVARLAAAQAALKETAQTPAAS